MTKALYTLWLQSGGWVGRKQDWRRMEASREAVASQARDETRLVAVGMKSRGRFENY